MLISYSPRLVLAQAAPTQTYTINFPTASAKTDPELLHHLVEELNNTSSYRLVLQGHTDNEGSTSSNLQLSKARVKTIQKQLLAAGVSPERIQTVAYGESRPIATNTTAAGRTCNRRVDVILTTLEDWEAPKKALKATLNHLAEARKQDFEVVAGQAQNIVGRGGTHISIPADAFDVPKGTKVQLKLTEAYKVSDMLINQLSTISNGEFLTTGGMIKLEALANGQAVGLKSGKSLAVNVPTDNPTKEMMLYEMEQLEGSTNWINPQPLTIGQMPATTNTVRLVGIGGVEGYTEEQKSLAKYLSVPYRRLPSDPNKPIERKITALDSATYKDYQAKITDLEQNPWKSFKPYRQKRFLFIKYKVKKSKEDSLKHQRSIENRLNRLRKLLTSEQNKLVAKQEGFQLFYQQELGKYKVLSNKRDSLLKVNQNLMIKHKDARMLQRQQYNYFEYSEATILAIAKQIYTKHNAEAIADLLEASEPIHDSIILAHYCNLGDTMALNLILNQKNLEKMTACIFPENSVFRQANTMNRVWSYRSSIIGLNDYTYTRTPTAPISKEMVIQNEIRRSYSFQLNKMGRFINCDHPPQWFANYRRKNAFVNSNKPAGITQTYIVFENKGIIASAFYWSGSIPSYVEESNQQYFPRIPVNLPIKVISISVNQHNKIELAVVRTRSKGALPKLQYQAVDNTRELVKLLEQLDA